MTEDEKQQVHAAVDNEGFDYAFTSYSDFPEVKDEEFHRLRKEFLEARKRLAAYIDRSFIEGGG